MLLHCSTFYLRFVYAIIIQYSKKNSALEIHLNLLLIVIGKQEFCVELLQTVFEEKVMLYL